MSCILQYYVEYLYIIHNLFLKEEGIQNLKELSKLWRDCLTCAHATNQIQKDG